MYSLLDNHPRNRMQCMMMGCVLLGLGIFLYGTVSVVNGTHHIDNCMNMVVTNTNAICEIMKHLSPNANNITCMNV